MSRPLFALLLPTLVLLTGCAAEGAFLQLQRGEDPRPHEVKVNALLWNRLPGGTSVQMRAPPVGLDCTCSVVLAGERCTGDCQGQHFPRQRAGIALDLPATTELRHCGSAERVEDPPGKARCRLYEHGQRSPIQLELDGVETGVLGRADLNGHVATLDARGARMAVVLADPESGITRGEHGAWLHFSGKEADESCGAVSSLDVRGNVLWTRPLAELFPRWLPPSATSSSDGSGPHARRAARSVEAPRVALDGEGSVWVAEPASRQVVRLDSEGRQVFSGAMAPLKGLRSMAVAKDGQLLWAIGEIDGALRARKDRSTGRCRVPLWPPDPSTPRKAS